MGKTNNDIKNKILILVGLPGSGKTTFAIEYCAEKNQYLKRNHIDIDKGYGLFSKNQFKNNKEIIENRFVKNRTNVFDGLYLTNESIVNLINEIPNKEKYDYEIHYWEPNIEACLHNDIGRRKKDSIITIKNAKIEKPNISLLKNQTDVENIKIIRHEIVKKPEWRTWADTNVFEGYVNNENNKYMYSESWSLGGTYGSCYGGLTTVSPDTPLSDFKKFDELLEKICPTITFLEYKKLYRECCDIVEEYDHDYYGGCTTNARFRCDLEKLYELLNENNILNKK